VVKAALLPSNKDEMLEFESWAQTIPWMDEPLSYSIHFDLRCRRDNEVKNNIIRGLRISGQEGLELLARRKDRYISKMREFCSKFMRPPGDRLFSCGAGIGGGCVDAYGYFQPCIMLRHPDTTYDIKHGTLKDAITNFFPKIRKMKASNPDYLSCCAKCFLKGLCEQCMAKSWMEYGTLDTPVKYLCEIAHTQARYLGLLKKGEKAWEIEDWKDRTREFSRKGETIFDTSEKEEDLLWNQK